MHPFKSRILRFFFFYAFVSSWFSFCYMYIFLYYIVLKQFYVVEGWSGGAKVLGKLAVPGRPSNLDYSSARAYCACSRRGWGLFGHFFLSSVFSLFFLPLWETARY